LHEGRRLQDENIADGKFRWTYSKIVWTELTVTRKKPEKIQSWKAVDLKHSEKKKTFPPLEPQH
jgi:hypothetical protein